MKRKLFIPFLLLCFGFVFSQTSNDKITYLDSLYNPATETNYTYKRVVEDYYNDKEQYNIVEYYNSGNVKMKGITVHRDQKSLKGSSTTYYENGNRESFIIKSPSSLNFKEFQWYENGEKKSEREFIYDEKTLSQTIRILQFWEQNNSHKVIDGNGEYEEDSKLEYSKGKCVNGYKDGIWSGTNKKYNFSFTETYKNGKLISGISIDSNLIKHYYTLTDEEGDLLRSKKGDELFEYIQDNIPSLNEKSEFYNKGNLVEITIDQKGKLTKVQTKPDINQKIEKSITKVLEKHKKTLWKPQIDRGVAIPTVINIGYPIRTNVIRIIN